MDKQFVCMCVSYSRNVSVHYGPQDFHPLSHHCVVDQLERERVLQDKKSFMQLTLVI